MTRPAPRAAFFIAAALIGVAACDGITDVNGGDDNAAPVAVAATPSTTVTVGTTVTLDGTASSDADEDDLTFSWELTSVPSGSGAALSGADQAVATFTPDAAGQYVAALTVSDGTDSAADTLTVTAEVETDLSGTISSDTTLTDVGQAYQVTGTLRVDAALVIEPGVVMQFESDAAIDVTSGSISAVGTQTDTIRFVGTTQSPGFWRGIRVGTNDPANEMAYVEIAHAGSADFGTTGVISNLHVDAPGQLSISNSLIRNSGDIGLAVDNGAAITFSENRFSGSTGPGVTVGARVVGMLDAATVYDDPADPNGDPWIAVWDDNVTQDATWPAPATPYLFESETNIQAAVTIDSGAELWFTAGAALDVDAGSLAAIGTAGAPIVFRGQNEVPGHWRGIRFQTNDPLNELTHVHVSDGGEDDFGTTGVLSNVHMDAPAQVKINNSRFTNSAVYGLYIDNSASLPEFAGNHFAGNGDAGLVVGAEIVGSLDTVTVYDDAGDANGKPYIRVTAADVQQDATWPAAHSPYAFENETNIEAAVDIEPGAVLWFTFGAGLDVNTGSLSAVGTQTDTIKFLGSTATSGHWRGIRFQTNDPANELTYVETAHGGEDDFGTTGVRSNVHVDGSASLTITNSTFRDSDEVGLFIESGNSIPAFTANRFSGNIAAGLKLAANQVASLDAATVYNDSSDPNGEDYIDVYGETVGQAGTWPAPAAPYRFTGETNVEADIAVDPGAELWFAANAGLDVTGTSGSLAAIGTDTQPIIFRGEIETAGYWRGIRVQTNNPLNELKYAEVYHGGADDFGTTGVLANVHVDAPGQLTLSFSTFDMSADWDVFKDTNATVDDSDGNNQYLSGGKNF